MMEEPKWSVDGLLSAIVDQKLNQWCEDLPENFDVPGELMMKQDSLIRSEYAAMDRETLITKALGMGIIQSADEVEA